MKDNTFRFQCTECGDCCRRPGVVEFDDEDFQEVLGLLSLSRREFIAEYYCTEEDDTVTLWVEEGRPCEFLQDNRCSIFEARPKQCRTYPFWEELLNRKSWDAEGFDCPGINEGPVYSKSDIEAIIEHNHATKNQRMKE